MAIVYHKDNTAVVPFWRFWHTRRGQICEIFRPNGADTTNNLSEISHFSWHTAGAVNLSLAECALFDLGESFLMKSYEDSMYGIYLYKTNLFVIVYLQGTHFRSEANPARYQTRQNTTEVMTVEEEYLLQYFKHILFLILTETSYNI